MNPQQIIEKHFSLMDEEVEEFAWLSGKFLVKTCTAIHCGHIKAGKVEITHTWKQGTIHNP